MRDSRARHAERIRGGSEIMFESAMLETPAQRARTTKVRHRIIVGVLLLVGAGVSAYTNQSSVLMVCCVIVAGIAFAAAVWARMIGGDER